ncbi:ParB/RepB/Spo0J family partition protein [Marilutibacter aestuarii]|uniref:ParB/RepB/Spo0J family partition protein n=1 Tax=Marilutibacter aestuarii TaxID=1706195 RepID=A0A508AU39_9GAMM|nr:ParB/RepB/Spo0J family partition protein [Lysobacter aestuarii]TQD51208.1 ParB/RepB/Spo0J family partition protein [Lysobacter aestuarii]
MNAVSPLARAEAASLQRIALAHLQLSPLNARKTQGEGVENLAASIEAHGLLQNLTVLPAEDAGTFEVIAGGRRLAALQLLDAQGRLPTTLREISCLVVDDADIAVEASTAENTLREAMHPADEFDAFRRMIDAGKPIPDIAAHFGVTERVVRQRLKLANVNPDLVQVYRDGGMTLEQLQVLALTDNHDLQKQAWGKNRQDYERSPYHLRQFLTQSDVSADDALAKFVGLEAYEQAGGTVRRDLFSDRAWLTDRALLDQLAMDRLEQTAQALRDAGWSWVEARIDLDYAARAEFPSAPRIDVELAHATPEDAAREAEVEARLEKLENGSEDLTDAEQEECWALQDELTKIEDRKSEIWPERIMAQAGALVTVGHNGIEVSCGRLKPGEKLGKSGTVTGGADASAPAKPKAPTLSAAVLRNLSAHLSEEARHHVSRDPQLALALLVDRFASDLAGTFSHARLLTASGGRGADAAAIAPDNYNALRPKDEVAEACRMKMPRAKRLTWLIKQPQQDLLDMLAYLVAQSFDGMTDHERGHAGVQELHEAIGFDMAERWNPGCDNFVGRVPKPYLLAAIAEAKGKDVAKSVEGLKKGELAAEAAKLLAGTGWLPKTLRGPSYGSAAKGKAAKKPAKKAAKKRAAAAKPKAKKASKAA